MLASIVAAAILALPGSGPGATPLVSWNWPGVRRTAVAPARAPAAPARPAEEQRHEKEEAPERGAPPLGPGPVGPPGSPVAPSSQPLLEPVPGPLPPGPPRIEIPPPPRPPEPPPPPAPVAHPSAAAAEEAVKVAAAARPPPSPLVAVRTARAPRLDGKLDDDVWATAPVSSHFTEQYPDEDTPPAEPTEVRALYDEHALYLAIRCVQRNAPITARLTRRDRVTSADRVTVDISSRADGLTAFHFGVNAAGVLDDGIFFDDTTYSGDWDENWEARVARDGEGWSVEIRLPFRILRFEARPVHRWGIEIERYTEATHEWDHWAFRPRRAATFVSAFGALEGIAGIAPARPFELRFVGVGRYRHRDREARSDTLAPAHDWTGALELDAKAHPTQGTTFDLTVNPDFGQVESDQVVLNLSTFETFFPEKRPFFLEGIDTFATPRTVLYTRRIGAVPTDPALTGTEKLVDHAGPSRIWTAAKLVGTATPRTNIGLLSALVAENTVPIGPAASAVTGGADSTSPPARVPRLASPLALYNAARARHLWGRGGDVGLLATTVNRFEPSGSDRVTDDAYVAALDGHWYSPSGDYRVAGQAVGSMLAGGPARADRDGIAVRPGALGAGGTVTAAKVGGAHWLASTTQALSGRQLDYNDFGYLDRKNDYFSYADLTYRAFEPWWLTSERSATLAISHRQTLDGVPLGDNVRFQVATVLKSFWAANAAVYYHSPYFDDRETGDGVALERARLTGGEVWVGADSRHVVSGAFWAQILDIANGRLAQFIATVNLRPTPRLELELNPTGQTTSGEPRYVSKDAGPAGAGVYRFGRLQATNMGLTVRATVGLLPTLTLQLYGQLFLATKHFTSFSHADTQGLLRARVRLADLVGGDAPPATNPDSAQAVLNLNLVLRWEFKLGSVIYFVYTRAQAPSITVPNGEVPRLDVAPLRANHGAVDALMLKISYWWG